MRVGRMGMAATATCLTLVLAGCGGGAGDNGAGENAKQQPPSQAGGAGGPSSSAGQQAPQADKAGVEWIGGFCGSMQKFVASYKSAPPPKSQDPAAIKQATSEQLSTIASGAQTVLADLDKMEPSPIKGGDKLVSNAEDSYSQILASAKKAKSAVDDAPASDKQSVMQAVKSASKEFKKSTQKNPLQPLKSNKKLSQAFRQAPQCKQLAQSAQPKKPQQGQPGQQPGGQQAPSPGN